MSEVKRYELGNCVFILASDYDAREAKWKEVVRELVSSGQLMYEYQIQITDRAVPWAESRRKALALLNDQPQGGQEP